MKRIGLLSDTHGYLDERIIELLGECDEIWHAGDIGTTKVTEKLAQIRPLRAVYGNIDGGSLRLDHPLEQLFELEGVKVWMIHIGGYPGRYPKKIKERIESLSPQLFICGHSHILKIIWDKKYELLHINPGAAGNKGFHKLRTMVRFSLDNGNIKDMEVIELGPRSSAQAIH
jgi:putative phosphoesterase